MTKAQAEQAKFIIGSIANSEGIRLVKVMLNGEVDVGALADQVGLSRSALSQHLTKFKIAGLLTQRRDRQSLYCTITPEWVDFVQRMILIGEEHAIWWTENPTRPRIATSA